jgi:hypothetical protein
MAADVPDMVNASTDDATANSADVKRRAIGFPLKDHPRSDHVCGHERGVFPAEAWRKPRTLVSVAALSNHGRILSLTQPITTFDDSDQMFTMVS